MSEVKMDLRSKEDIINQIEELSRSYTPEWRFNEKKPDVGTVLALVYAEMFFKNIQLLNKLISKNKITFFNQMGASILPPKASEGYVTFQLTSRDLPGAEVEAGTRVFAEQKDKEPKKISFETLEDLFVTPAELDHIIQTSAEQDYISFDYEGKTALDFPLFDFNRKNIQEHKLYLSHSDVFGIHSEGEIQIRFQKNFLQNLSEEMTKSFLDRGKVDITYLSEEGYTRFEEQRQEEGILVLKKGENQPPFTKNEVGGKEGLWICFNIKDIKPFLGFSCEGLKLKSKGYAIPPKVIYGAGVQCNPTEYMPFGKKMGIYQEVGFASDEVLGKKGARICLRFQLDFERSPLDTNIEKEIQWNWVMKNSDLKAEKEYDITIEKVIWEYYNGKGWNRLFSDDSYGDIFSTKNGLHNQFREVRFLCPDDMSYFVWDSVDSYYIRARILTMNNEYRLNGYYVTPILSETVFDFEYVAEQISPQYIFTKNNRESSIIKGNEINKKNRMKPFVQMDSECPTVYFGFSQEPVGDPIKILFILEEIYEGNPFPLRWEYYSESKWKSINVTDETEQFRKTGVVTIAGGDDYRKKRLYGKELYWIRVVDENQYYMGRESKKKRPVITGIHMNSVKASAVNSVETEYFQMREYETDKQFALLKSGVLSGTVWVQEGESESDWVLWERVNGFENSSPNDRHFMIDPGEGILLFGDGRRGKMPPTSEKNNIRICYRTGGGAYTNVAAGEIIKMEKSIGFISKVTNFVPFFGGCDEECTESALERNAAYLKHQNRAITAKDFEKLTLEVSHDIARVTCFAGYNEWGKRESGCIVLVVLQYSLEKGFLHFNTQKEQIISYLKPRMGHSSSAAGLLRVTEPRFVQINIKVNVTVKDFQDIFEIKRSIFEALERFLNPLTGNLDAKGWSIGEVPKVERVRNALSGIRGVTFLQQISMTYFLCKGTLKEEIDRNRAEEIPFVLPINGKHQVAISSL